MSRDRYERRHRFTNPLRREANLETAPDAPNETLAQAMGLEPAAPITPAESRKTDAKLLLDARNVLTWNPADLMKDSDPLLVGHLIRFAKAIAASHPGAARGEPTDTERLDWWFERGLTDSVCDGSVDLWWADEQGGNVVERVTHGTSVRDALDKAMRGLYEPEES